MTGPTRNARGQRTHAAIQSAALRLLRSEGPGAVSMESVAREAGCSRRALYLHFGSRAELLISLIRYIDENEGLVEQQAPVRDAPSAEQALRSWADFLARYHGRIAPIVLAVRRERDTDEAARHMWSSAMAGWRGSCAELVQRLEQDGVLHPRFQSPERAVDLMWSLMNLELLRDLVQECGWSTEDYGSMLGELLVSTFLA